MSAENFPGSGFPPSFEGLTSDSSKTKNEKNKKKAERLEAAQPAAEVTKQPERVAEVTEVFTKQPNLLQKLLGSTEEKAPEKIEKPEAGEKQPEQTQEATPETAEKTEETHPESLSETSAEVAELAELDVEEQPVVVEELVDGRVAELQKHAAETGETTDEDAAVLEFYDRSKANASEMEPEAAIESAADTVTGTEADDHHEQGRPTAQETEPSDDGQSHDYAAPEQGAGGHWNMPPSGGFRGYDAQPEPAADATDHVELVDVRKARRREAKAARESFIAGGVFFGIIGYLMGRRRGRIKAERLFEPVQKKLEKQVESLQQTMYVQEQRVRQYARQKAEVVRSLSAAKATEITASPAKAERANVPVSHAQPETVQTPRKQPEMAHYPAVTVEEMSQQEVIELGRTISVGNLTVAEAYEAKHLISEEGLRRVVAEHLRGGDVRTVYKQEVMLKRVAVEIRHELDPSLHGRPLTVDASWRGVQPQAADDQHANAQATTTEAQSTLSSPAALTPLVQRTARDEVPSSLVVANIAALAILAILLVVFLVVWLTR